MRVLAEIIGIVFLVSVAIFGINEWLDRWFNGPTKTPNKPTTED